MRKQLREVIIKPVLETLGLYSKEAEDLLYGTACVESGCGEYIVQVGKGPAKGIFQMEPATARDIYANFLKYKPDLQARVDALRCDGLSLEENLTGNLYYATAMCRVHYLRQPGAIPKDSYGQARYWKDFYNTALGKGTVEKYLKAYR